MKFLTALIIAFLFSAKSSMVYGGSQLQYRIQFAISSDNILSNKLKEIPEVKTFTLPSGSKIYFSGGYFNKYPSAQKRLEEVRKIGFDKAFIRVFKYSSLLSKSVGDSYIQKVKNKILLKSKNDTVAIVNQLVSISESYSGKVYSRAEITRIKKEVAEKKARKKIKIESSKSKVKEQKRKEEKIIEFDNIVKEPPVFKIFIGKYAIVNGDSKEFKQLKNEIIYTYQDRKETTYAVGFYKNEKEAQKDLPKYINLVKEAKIVGLYKGMIISLNLAKDLLDQFNKNNITK